MQLVLTVCGVAGLLAVKVVVLEVKAERKLYLSNMVAGIAQGNLDGTVV